MCERWEALGQAGEDVSAVIPGREGHGCPTVFLDRDGTINEEVNYLHRPEDLPRIFEKGFTGQNGRTVQSSTGIGLYLCRRLCDKLGIGISASSEGKGTAISLSFRINDFVVGVQS